LVQLSFGGATLDENRLMIEHLIGQAGPPISSGTCPSPASRLNPKDEVTRALGVKDRPLAHLFTFESLRATAYVLRKSCSASTSPTRCATCRWRSSSTTTSTASSWTHRRHGPARGLLDRSRR
jgi:hypothetical protein